MFYDKELLAWIISKEIEISNLIAI